MSSSSATIRLLASEVAASTPARLLSEDGHTKDAVVRSLSRAFQSTFFYGRLFRKQLRDKGIDADSITSIFPTLAFTSKDDVVRNYPYGFLAVERSEIAAYFESSGTTGNTIGSTKSASFFTRRDLERDASRRFSPDLGISESDVILNALPFALTSSGIGFQQASLAAGATAVSVDSGSLLSSHTKHIELLRDLEATIFVTSLPLLYSTLLQSEGRDPKKEFPHLRAIQLCGLPTLHNGKRKIQDIFGVPVFETYGLSEFGATTYTCSNGETHIHDSDFFVEVIDPRTGQLVDDGVGGEIVVTTLSREASPKIRYRTGDFGYIPEGRCTCGRSAPRLVIKGRIRDAALFGERFRLPIDFEEVVYSFQETTGLFRLLYEPLEPGNQSDQQVRATLTIDVSDPNQKGLRDAIEARIREEVTVHATVQLVRTGSAQASILDQQRFASVRTIKSAVLDDQRPQEWLVTY